MTDDKASRRIALWLVLLACVTYANALRNGFAFDDIPDLRENAAVTGGVDVIRILATPLPPGDLYRPLTVLTFALNEAVAPGNPWPFHAVNVLLHAAVTVLVFRLAMRLFASVRLATIAGVLFAVHPIHTEAVTNVVGRAELLAAFFGLLALLTAARADATPSRGARRVLQSVSIASFLLALLSKESALTVLPLIALYRVTLRREPVLDGARRELRSLDWVPYALCAILVLLLRVWVVGGLTASTVTPLDNVLAFVPWTVRVRSAVAVLWDYFGLLLVPLVLAADYSYAQVPLVTAWLTPRFLGGLLVCAGVGVVAIRNRRPAVTFAAVFPLLALSLTANVLFPIGTVMGERLLYLPSVGWVLLVAYGCDHLLRTERYRRAVGASLLVVVVFFAARTWIRNGDWQDNPTLYRSMARSAPNSAKSRYNFAVALQEENADEAAAAQFTRALAIYPWGGGAGSALGMGILYEKRGITDKAAEWYGKALEIEPGFDKAHTNLCRLMLVTGQFKRAIGICRNGLRYAPADANMLKGLGEALVGADDVDKGIAVLRRALALEQDDRDLRTRLGQLEMAAADDASARTAVQ